VHDGNSEVSRTAAIEVAYEMNTCILVVDWWKDVAQDKKRELFTYPGHAGENETSVMLHIAPELVGMSKAGKHIYPSPQAFLYILGGLLGKYGLKHS
jgi:creatinine amidohydrolase